VTGTELATTGEEDYSAGVGLEDTDATDVVLPRLSINGENATFENNLTNEEFPELYVVILGLVKQRIMWDKTVDEGDKPLCKSVNFQIGFPNVSEDTPKDKRFPWDESNFDPSQLKEDDEGRQYLPCRACVFKEWGDGPPPCSEQHTYPLLYSTTPDITEMSPAILSLKRSSMKASKSLISTFKTQNKSFFTKMVKMSLVPQKRGRVNYAVTKFQVLDGTNPAYWSDWGDQFTQIREYLRRPPRVDSDDDGEGDSVAATPPPAAAPAPESPVAGAAPKADVGPSVRKPAPVTPAPVTDIDDDDDLPF
jgi:hypothetical protein